jgi:hypothetical protein
VHGSCGNSHEISEILKCRLSHRFSQHFERIITHYKWSAYHFALHREHLFAHKSLNIVHHCLSSFTRYILAVNCASFMMDFRSTLVFSVYKADKSANFSAGGITSSRTHHNSLCRDRQEHTLRDRLCDGLGSGVDSAFNTNEYQRSLKNMKKPGGKVWPARRADNLAAIY